MAKEASLSYLMPIAVVAAMLVGGCGSPPTPTERLAAWNAQMERLVDVKVLEVTLRNAGDSVIDTKVQVENKSSTRDILRVYGGLMFYRNGVRECAAGLSLGLNDYNLIVPGLAGLPTSPYLERGGQKQVEVALRLNRLTGSGKCDHTIAPKWEPFAVLFDDGTELRRFDVVKGEW